MSVQRGLRASARLPLPWVSRSSGALAGCACSVCHGRGGQEQRLCPPSAGHRVGPAHSVPSSPTGTHGALNSYVWKEEKEKEEGAAASTGRALPSQRPCHQASLWSQSPSPSPQAPGETGSRPQPAPAPRAPRVAPQLPTVTSRALLRPRQDPLPGRACHRPTSHAGRRRPGGLSNRPSALPGQDPVPHPTPTRCPQKERSSGRRREQGLLLGCPGAWAPALGKGLPA